MGLHIKFPQILDTCPLIQLVWELWVVPTVYENFCPTMLHPYETVEKEIGIQHHEIQFQSNVNGISTWQDNTFSGVRLAKTERVSDATVMVEKARSHLFQVGM